MTPGNPLHQFVRGPQSLDTLFGLKLCLQIWTVLGKSRPGLMHHARVPRGPSPVQHQCQRMLHPESMSSQAVISLTVGACLDKRECCLQEVLIVHSVGTCQADVFNQNCEPPFKWYAKYSMCEHLLVHDFTRFLKVKSHRLQVSLS